MSREDESFSVHIQITTLCDLLLNLYVQELELKVFELESSLVREQMDKDKWKKFYMEKDEEVDRLKLELDKAKKLLLPANSMSKRHAESRTMTPSEAGVDSSADDWIKKPVKPYRPIISKEDVDELGIFWEHKQAAACTRTGIQNNLLNPVQVLHQLVFHETDNTVVAATQLSVRTADVIRNDATFYTKSYLDTTKLIKNQTRLCRTTYLPNILRRLKADYSSVPCLGKTDWMARIFVTSVLWNTSGSSYNNEDEQDSGHAEEGGRTVMRGVKRKHDVDGFV
ncbi:hypothetical protein BT69DRAFT_1351254, partial [Atractiella rhizophila]